MRILSHVDSFYPLRPKMFTRLAVISALALGSVVAHATPISQISIRWSDSFTVSGSSGSITFFNPVTVGAGATGNFAVFTGGNPVTMFPTLPAGTPLPFALGSQTVMSRLGVASVEALTTTEASTTLDFFLTDYSVSLVSGITGRSETPPGHHRQRLFHRNRRSATPRLIHLYNPGDGCIRGYRSDLLRYRFRNSRADVSGAAGDRTARSVRHRSPAFQTRLDVTANQRGGGRRRPPSAFKDIACHYHCSRSSSEQNAGPMAPIML